MPQSVVAEMGKSTQSSRLAIDPVVVCPIFSTSRRRHITDQKRAKDTVNASEIPLNVLAEAAADGGILIDDQSTILFVNPASGQIFGYQPAELVGNNLTSLMPEYLRQIHLTSLKRYIGTGQRPMSGRSVELTGLHKSGREFPIEVSFTEHTSQGRRFFTVFIRDITGRKRAEEALRESERRLQDILDNTTAVVFVKDLELRYILVNREYERLHQVQRDQICGKTDFDIHPSDVAETLRTNDRNVIEAGTPIQFEEAVPTAEGERQYVVVKFLLRDRTAKPYAVCCIATDITELKRAEELQARRARQAALRADIHAAFSVGTQNTLQAILQRSAEAVVRHLDGAFARIWTLNSRQNLLELQASAGLYTRLDGEHARVPVGKLKIGLIAQERKPHLTNDVLNDNRISHPDWAKQERMVSFAGYPLLVEGRLVGVLAMFARKFLGQDTLEALEGVADTIAQGIERKRAEEELRRSEAYLTQAQRLSRTGSFWWKVSSGELIWSDEAFRVMGYDQTMRPSVELVFKRVHPEDIQLVQHMISRAAREGTNMDHEHRLLMPDGSVKHVHVVLEAVCLDPENREFVGAVMDITARKQAEEAVSKARTELAHMTRVTTVGQLTASIAHEINQPLSAIVTNADAGLRWLAQDSPNLEETSQAIRRIIRDGKRASAVVSRMRALFEKAPTAKEPLDINEVIQEVLTLTQSEVHSNHVSPQTQFANDLPLVMGDRIQLQQVILNLLVNAIQAMSGVPEGPRELGVSSEKVAEINGESKEERYEGEALADAEWTHVLITVRDSGPGLDPQSLNRLFDAFYTTKPQGLGMGLSISRSIIEAHGGRLWAKANAPRGAVFQFALPISR
jgi:PAS domain S-box-containing protein